MAVPTDDALALIAAHGITGCWNPSLSGFVTLHTTPNAATTAYTRGTGLKPTGGDTAGKLLRYRRCSMSGRRCKTSGRLCGGDQPQRGQRIRGPWGSRIFSWSGSRSDTVDNSLRGVANIVAIMSSARQRGNRVLSCRSTDPVRANACELPARLLGLLSAMSIRQARN